MKDPYFFKVDYKDISNNQLDMFLGSVFANGNYYILFSSTTYIFNPTTKSLTTATPVFTNSPYSMYSGPGRQGYDSNSNVWANPLCYTANNNGGTRGFPNQSGIQYLNNQFIMTMVYQPNEPNFNGLGASTNTLYFFTSPDCINWTRVGSRTFNNSEQVYDLNNGFKTGGGIYTYGGLFYFNGRYYMQGMQWSYNTGNNNSYGLLYNRYYFHSANLNSWTRTFAVEDGSGGTFSLKNYYGFFPAIYNNKLILFCDENGGIGSNFFESTNGTTWTFRASPVDWRSGLSSSRGPVKKINNLYVSTFATDLFSSFNDDQSVTTTDFVSLKRFKPIPLTNSYHNPNFAAFLFKDNFYYALLSNQLIKLDLNFDYVDTEYTGFIFSDFSQSNNDILITLQAPVACYASYNFNTSMGFVLITP